MHTFDSEKDLHPVYLGDVRKIDKVVKKKYDCVICCQVLEHIEYRYFEPVIRKISKICKKRLILSLPECMAEFSIYAELLKIGYKECHILLPKFWLRRFKIQSYHHWEVGMKGKGKREIRRVLSNYFDIRRDYNASGHMYHWYIIADAKKQ